MAALAAADGLTALLAKHQVTAAAIAQSDADGDGAGLWVMHSTWQSQEACVLRACNKDRESCGAELRAGVSQEVVVWRQGLRPQFRQALPGEVDLLQHLMTGAAMGPALDHAPELDFTQWFPSAVASQLVLGVFTQAGAADL